MSYEDVEMHPLAIYANLSGNCDTILPYLLHKTDVGGSGLPNKFPCITYFIIRTAHACFCNSVKIRKFAPQL